MNLSSMTQSPGLLAAAVLVLGLICHGFVFLCGGQAKKHNFFRAGLIMAAFAPVFYWQLFFTRWLIASADHWNGFLQTGVFIGAITLLPWTIALVVYKVLASIAAPHSLRSFAIPGLKLLFGLKLSDHDAEIVYSAAADGASDSVSGLSHEH